MPQQVLNGVMKPADVIAKGPHRYNEATRKYEEIPAVLSEYPRAMWQHEKREYTEAQSRDEQRKLEAEGWKTKPFAEKVAAKDTVVASPVNLAEVLLQQELEMKSLKAQIEEMKEKRGPGRPKASEL